MNIFNLIFFYWFSRIDILIIVHDHFYNFSENNLSKVPQFIKKINKKSKPNWWKCLFENIYCSLIIRFHPVIFLCGRVKNNYDDKNAFYHPCIVQCIVIRTHINKYNSKLYMRQKSIKLLLKLKYCQLHYKQKRFTWFVW